MGVLTTNCVTSNILDFVQYSYISVDSLRLHICISKLNIISSDNGFCTGQYQAIIWTNAGILLTWPLGTNFSEMLIKIHTFSFKKMQVKMLSVKWWTFCLSLNVLTQRGLDTLGDSLHMPHFSLSIQISLMCAPWDAVDKNLALVQVTLPNNWQALIDLLYPKIWHHHSRINQMCNS